MPSPNPAGPRPWLWSVQIPSGARGLLVYLWTYGPHWQPGDPEPEHGAVQVWPMRRTIAADFGVSLNTVKSWLRKLTEAGLIRREGNGWALASGGPCADWSSGQGLTVPGSQQTRVTADPGEGLTVPDPGLTSPSPGLRGPPIEPAIEPASKPATEPAKSEQAPLVLVPDEPDPVAEIRAEHEALRKAALAKHGLRQTGLPKRTAKTGVVYDRRLAAALGKHGASTCRRILAWQAERWHEDVGQVSYPPAALWSPKSVAFALARMAEASSGSSLRARGGWVNRYEPTGRPAASPACDEEIDAEAVLLAFDGVTST